MSARRYLRARFASGGRHFPVVQPWPPYPDTNWVVDAIFRDTDAPRDAVYFFRNPYLNQLEDKLHTTLLFNWMQQKYGPIDAPIITRREIVSVWQSFASCLDGTVMAYYVDKEFNFWKEMLN